MSDTRKFLHQSGVRNRDLAGAIAAASITLISALGLSVLSGWLITRAWQMPPILDLAIAITAVRALGISRAVFRYIDRLISHRLALRALRNLRSTVFQSIAETTTPHSDAFLTQGDQLTRLSKDTERVTDLIVRSLVPAGTALVVSIIAVAFAALLLPTAGLVLLAGFCVTGVLIPWLSRRSSNKRLQRAAVESEDTWEQQLQGVLSHRVEFHAAGIAQQRAESAVAASRRASHDQIRATRNDSVQAFLLSLSCDLTVLGIAWLGVQHYGGSPMWLGMLVILSLAAFESHAELAKASVYADVVSTASRALAEVTGEALPRHPATQLPHDTTLTVSQLQCLHTDKTWNFTLEPNERLLITGPSGLGKTTLLYTLAGLLEPCGGSASIGGDATAEAKRALIRMHPENEWLFSTTIRENIRVANPDASDDLIDTTLRALGLGQWLDANQGLDTVLLDGASSLSSGQRRRLLLARALCSTAPIVLLDEPTAHISHTDVSRILDTLLHQPLPGALPHRSLIIVSHDQRKPVRG
ncbi:thiol reductant ABC exporter subunit CydC [Corynebacterium ulcerans]|uniref:thiol reductant ABC exporter subunit CydC n=1 Tax=Corynebacterium ulcerans TaxID=65058 RepID=UPI0005FEA976|nr:thiol reductant ABC exporter subunit CydC [Corynebacterium ulcerans]AKA97318.1 ATP-binding/permease protein [Corynebacterium ulcerans]